jgi:putative SOS response-associated peptidase YedK
MCGRYTLHQKAKILVDRFDAQPIKEELRDNYNVAPGQFMPVVVNQEGKTKLELMKWGLVPFWAKDPKIGYKLINARSETLFEKPMWRNVIKKKRCLIPADGFYEWKRVKEDNKEVKHPFYIHPKQEDLFSFAGVWESWKDVEGLEWKTYSIITTEPNKEMASVHNRMPVILHREDEASWLEPSLDLKEDIEPFLQPYEDGGLKMYEVSSNVNSPKNNNSELIYEL